MEQANEADWEERAQHALGAYRERRRRRRAEDTYFGSADCLLSKAEAGIGMPEREKRREEILADAAEHGMPPRLAELLYDVAREEVLDPALAFELVRCGIGVLPPEEGVSNAPSQPSSDPYIPEWLGSPIPTDDLLQERTLRLSFRRLRGLLEAHSDVDDAFRAFAREPDVGAVGY
ncbi:MAG: hypothetical protein M3409_02225 [Gemmatimonadota bacterium]|nr:hypothetical protein [Gemmatimonadota bacterium]